MATRKNSHYRHLQKTPFYRSWCGMKSRCQNKNHSDYPRYGARGIKVCDRWQNFDLFYKDMFDLWSEHVKNNPQTTLDRINVNGDYEPSNCKWATKKEQSNNRRHHNILSYKGRKMNLNQWAEFLGIKRSTLAQRIYVYKWPVDRALTQ